MIGFAALHGPMPAGRLEADFAGTLFAHFFLKLAPAAANSPSAAGASVGGPVGSFIGAVPLVSGETRNGTILFQHHGFLVRECGHLVCAAGHAQRVAAA